MVNEPELNAFLRKRFSSKEVYTAQVAVDLLHDNQVQAVVLSEFFGGKELILDIVMAIRRASPVKIIYIAHTVPEDLGRALMGIGALVVEGGFSEEQLVALVEQYYNEDAVRRFSIPEIAAAAAVNAKLPSVIRQRIVSIVGAPGAGKSVIAGGLARAASKSVKTVLVDVANFPVQHVYFSIKDEYHHRNITKYAINSSARVQDYLVEIEPNLSLLPGAVTTWGEPKISTGRMSVLIDDLRSQFDVIIFDCSPFINEIATDDAVKASQEVVMVTTADLVGLHNATRLFPYLSSNVVWLQNRFVGSDLNHFYMRLINKKRPAVTVADIPYTDLTGIVSKGKVHPVIEKGAEELSIKVLKLASPKKKAGFQLPFRRGKDEAAAVRS